MSNYSNPLFPSNKDDDSSKPGPKPHNKPGADEAVELLRQKINKLYGKEPDAKEEIKEAKAHTRPQSKHQQFMFNLSNSGKSLAEIQTEWHNYYVGLPDEEKHQVWQEFYADHGRSVSYQSPNANPNQQPISAAADKPQVHHITPGSSIQETDKRTKKQIKSSIIRNIKSRSQSSQQKQSPLKSLMFGFGMGMIVLVIMLFGFFNERFIAPFITPSRNVSITPIVAGSSTTVSPDPKIIIPKINVEIPVIFDEPSISEDAIQRALEEGVVHYATTSKPGEKGNGAIFGHSSNNILNRGKYKFAFALLNRLEEGDTFIVQHNSKQYVYRIYKTHVVPPTEVSVLNPQEKPATMTLITCDPPGTSLNRLVVVGEQISPDPGINVASTAKKVDEKAAVLPSNAPSLWDRITNWF